MITHRWTPKAAARRSERKLRALEKRIEKAAIEIAGEWGDEDQYIANLADRLRDCAVDVFRDLREALGDASSREPAE